SRRWNARRISRSAPWHRWSDPGKHLTDCSYDVIGVLAGKLRVERRSREPLQDIDRARTALLSGANGRAGGRVEGRPGGVCGHLLLDMRLDWQDHGAARIVHRDVLRAHSLLEPFAFFLVFEGEEDSRAKLSRRVGQAAEADAWQIA